MAQPSPKKPAKALVQTLDQAEDRFLAFVFRYRLALFIAVVTLISFWGRMSLWPFVSADYNECLHLWMDEVRQGRGFHSIGTQIGNYTAPYHYLMAAMSYIPGLTNLDVIKITSSVSDYAMAASLAFLCWQMTRSHWRSAAAYAIVLCLPTVFLNSAAWGQCDSMYTTWIILFMGLYLAGKPRLGLLCFGFALAIKLQAIFILPAVLILWLCGRIRLRQLLYAPVGYFVLFIPAMIGSRSFSPLFQAYAMQTKVHNLASNIFTGAALFKGFAAEDLDMIAGMLIPATMVAVGIIALYCWQRKQSMTRQTDFLLILLMAALIPFLLPAMKDRYYYMIEVLTVVYALIWPRRMLAPLLMQLVSLPSYIFYLTNAGNEFMPWMVLVAGFVPIVLFWDLYRHLSAGPRQVV